MLTKTLIKYCSLFSRGVDKRRIRMFLESSPNYPNLLSVVQTLRYAGINVEVGRCDVDYLKSISGPVLLHLNLPGNQVMAIARPEVSGEGLSIFMPKTTKWEFRKFVDLVRVWDGVVVYAIDKPIGELLRQPSGTIYSRLAHLNFLQNQNFLRHKVDSRCPIRLSSYGLLPPSRIPLRS